MKKIFTLLFTIPMLVIAHAQVCTTPGFDVCATATGISSDLRNAVQIAGTGNPLSIGAKYKFNNAIPALNLDAIISIDAIENATLSGIDDDGATNENNTAGTQASLFSPRIAPDQKLSCSNRSGYIEFSVKFFTHYNGNKQPIAGSEMAVHNLNLTQFDLDGFIVGSNGSFKEISEIKSMGFGPMIYYANSTELKDGGDHNGWSLAYGSTAERTGIARCAEVMENAVYHDLETVISFRLGYEYTAPTTGCSGINIQPVRDYGSRFGCFTLPAAGPLPVSLVNLAGSYNDGKSTISWTSLQENNLDSYEIQRSFDGKNFEVAGNVKANNLSSVQQYELNDDVSSFNIKYIYYRIRIVDLDHSMKLTNTVLVKVEDVKANEMTISPNPSSSNAQIKMKITKACTGDISVFDAAGKVVLKQQATLQAGNNSIVLNNITLLSEGYYTIRLIANNEIYSSKLLIWK